MKTTTQFTPEREELIEEARGAFGNHRNVLLAGMSGFGKTTLAREIARRESKQLVEVGDKKTLTDMLAADKPSERGDRDKTILCIDVETNELHAIGERIAGIRDRASRIMFLANYGRGLTDNKGNPYPEHHHQLMPHGFEFNNYQIPVFTPQQTGQITRGESPYMSPIRALGWEEQNAIYNYSLGIPLLITQLLAQPSRITEDRARMLLGNYVQSYFGYSDAGKAAEIMQKTTGRSKLKKEDVLNYIYRGTDKGIIIPPNDTHLFPVDTHTFEIYYDEFDREKCRNLKITIYIPSLAPQQAREIYPNIAFSGSYAEEDTSRLKRFRVDMRKTGLHYHEEFRGDYEAFHVLEEKYMAPRIRENIGKIAEQSHMEPSTDAMIAQSRDHHEFTHNQRQFGYALETYLQGEGIPYAVQYGTDNEAVHGIYTYDPAQKRMIKCA